MKLCKLCFWKITLCLLASCAFAEQEKTTVGILIYDGVQIIDFTGPWEIFGQARFDVKTISQNGKTIKTAMNMKVGADYSFADAPRFDVLLVPGGHHHNAMDDATVKFIQHQSEHNETVLSVCTGSYILAETGLLNSQSATTFFKAIQHFQEKYPKIAVVSDRRYVDNGKVVTSAGLSSGIDAALHVVAKIKGVDAARTIAMHVEYDWHPEQGFVRGKMADQFMPRFKKKIPESIEFERTSAYGSDVDWFETYDIKVNNDKDPITEVETLLHEQLAALPNWQRLSTADQKHDEMRWRTIGNGEPWMISVKNLRKGPHQIEMRVALAKLNLDE